MTTKPLLDIVQSLAKAVAEVGRQVKDMRIPSSEFLREQALKIAEYKSPGMWVLMARYQSFADELKAEAEKEALPDQTMPEASAGATPESGAPLKVISAFQDEDALQVTLYLSYWGRLSRKIWSIRSCLRHH